MRIAYIIPGTGGTFYCQNCMRDLAVIHALRDIGHDVIAVPLYLPPRVGSDTVETDAPIFYGAVGLYLKHILPFLRFFPRFITKLFDSRFMLRYAARKAGTTKAHGLEDMTVSMLKGEEGNQSGELARMVRWLKDQKKIDVVHISNALLLGLVPKMKEELNIPVVCSLQDEEQWIDCMEPPYPDKVWSIIRGLSDRVDAFISVSEYYTDEISRLFGIPADRIETIYPGIEMEKYAESERPFDPPVIGYLARVARSQGLGLLLDAFSLIKKEEAFRDIRLHISGGQTGDDVAFIDEIKQRIRNEGIEQDVVFF